MNIESNVELFRMINDLGKEYTYLNPVSVFVAEYVIFLLGLMLLVYWFKGKNQDRLMVSSAVFSVILGEVLGKIAGRFYSNLQPFVELNDVNKLIEKDAGNSFPSDHTIVVFAVCFTFFLFKKKYRPLWLLVAVAVGISRMLVGVHYPLDVATGAVIAMASAFICYQFVSKSKMIQRYGKGQAGKRA